ncbi:MAG TPA: hypothetical protein VJI13_06730 [Candidatus Norongarragalinales archaeon]|nr:hypothetical protein [Candidatus Norongarragalinales archaeon]
MALEINENGAGEDMRLDDHFQACPYCNNLMGAIRGSVNAICRHCGYKEPCCF